MWGFASLAPISRRVRSSKNPNLFPGHPSPGLLCASAPPRETLLELDTILATASLEAPTHRERPFEPFVIVLSNGSRHEVPSPDHCTVTRISRRVTVDHDDGSFVLINPLHIAQIELLHKPSA